MSQEMNPEIPEMMELFETKALARDLLLAHPTLGVRRAWELATEHRVEFLRRMRTIEASKATQQETP